MPKKKSQLQRIKTATKTIDARGQVLGRLATQVTIILRGKDKPTFRPNLIMGDKVLIINASKIRITGNKMNDKLYRRHSGYLGHLKTQSMIEIYRKNPSELIWRAVRGMLPKNKLQDRWLKNLIILNGEENAQEKK